MVLQCGRAIPLAKLAYCGGRGPGLGLLCTCTASTTSQCEVTEALFDSAHLADPQGVAAFGCHEDRVILLDFVLGSVRSFRVGVHDCGSISGSWGLCQASRRVPAAAHAFRFGRAGHDGSSGSSNEQHQQEAAESHWLPLHRGQLAGPLVTQLAVLLPPHFWPTPPPARSGYRRWRQSKHFRTWSPWERPCLAASNSDLQANPTAGRGLAADS